MQLYPSELEMEILNKRNYNYIKRSKININTPVTSEKELAVMYGKHIHDIRVICSTASIRVTSISDFNDTYGEDALTIEKEMPSDIFMFLANKKIFTFNDALEFFKTKEYTRCPTMEHTIKKVFNEFNLNDVNKFIELMKKHVTI